jgi:hypothetical protein
MGVRKHQAARNSYSSGRVNGVDAQQALSAWAAFLGGKAEVVTACAAE